MGNTSIHDFKMINNSNKVKYKMCLQFDETFISSIYDRR